VSYIHDDMPLGADMPHTFWYCNACEAQNSCEDGECQFCECEGAECRRDSCSDPRHFTPECQGHPAGAFDPMEQTVYCDGSCQTVRP
jgi:hypothetical protein